MQYFETDKYSFHPNMCEFSTLTSKEWWVKRDLDDKIRLCFNLSFIKLSSNKYRLTHSLTFRTFIFVWHRWLKLHTRLDKSYIYIMSDNKMLTNSICTLTNCQINQKLKNYVKIKWMHEKRSFLLSILTPLSLLCDVDRKSYGSSSGVI